MNLVLDNIIFSIQASGGISAYWAVLISNLLNDLDISSQCLFIEPDKGYNNIFRKEIDIPPEKILKSKINLPIGIERYLSCKYHKESVFHSSYYRIVKNKNIKQVVTVHDFTYEKYYNGVTKKYTCVAKEKCYKKCRCYYLYF